MGFPGLPGGLIIYQGNPSICPRRMHGVCSGAGVGLMSSTKQGPWCFFFHSRWRFETKSGVKGCGPGCVTSWLLAWGGALEGAGGRRRFDELGEATGFLGFRSTRRPKIRPISLQGNSLWTPKRRRPAPRKLMSVSGNGLTPFQRLKKNSGKKPRPMSSPKQPYKLSSIVSLLIWMFPNMGSVKWLHSAKLLEFAASLGFWHSARRHLCWRDTSVCSVLVPCFPIP